MFYTYYVKAEGKYYFGSRTPKFMLNKDAKDDFMIHYFTSTSDERLREIIRKGEYEKAEIIKEYIDRQECLKDEELLIENFWWVYGTENCWNHYADKKFSMSGQKHSEKAKQKISEGHKGKQFSEEHKQKISEGHKGKPISEESKQKLSKAKKGKPSTFKGKQHSEESKHKLSEALKGKHHTEETKKKLSDTWNNKTDEEKQEIIEKCRNASLGERNGMYGKQHSEESKKKMSKVKKGKPKKKFYWKTTDGKIVVMSKQNAAYHHPDWVCLGLVE